MGTSNGGLMAMRLADEIPEKLSAAAFIISARPANSECVTTDAPLSVLLMNGTSDPILPYEGGLIAENRGELLSAIETINYWVNRNQTDLTPIEANLFDSDKDDASTVKSYSYLNGINNSVVEHREVINGGHTEPSISERYGRLFKLIVGNQNGDIEMVEEVWRFLD